ncbi:hypothetical protein [Chachezhania sediminis]|uniref:hypothetical protein n=1 Tax=Chachezhania sediminis TaxID=2599291 RepID=UPI001E2ED7A6|nr:hypothetical protein [Chachezhania sediminis]
MTPEEMIQLVVSGSEDDYSQELNSAFHNGFPIEHLKPLLTSKNIEIQGLGSHLAYELGPKVRPLLEEIVPLLESERPQIRSDAIIILLDCATRFDAEPLGKVFCLLDDPDPFVQRGAMRFVQHCERAELNVGINAAARLCPGTVFEDFPRFLGKDFYNYRPISRAILRQLLLHESVVAKRLAVGLASRPRQVVDKTFLDLVSEATEEECQNVLLWARNPTRYSGTIARYL